MPSTHATRETHKSGKKYPQVQVQLPNVTHRRAEELHAVAREQGVKQHRQGNRASGRVRHVQGT